MRVNMFRSMLFVLGMLACGMTHAQEQDKQESGFGVEANFIAGRIVKHTVKFTAPIPPLTTAMDVNFLWKTTGKKGWQQRRRYPQVGLGITYTDYGNNQVFGNCVGVYPNILIPIYNNNRFEFTLRMGDGVGYVTRKFQRTAPVDTVNVAIGTHLNDFGIFMFDMRYHVNQHWQLQYGFQFTHISNGGTEQPNLGVNTAGAHIGAIYHPDTYHPKHIKRELPDLPNRWEFNARMDLSYKQARAAGSPILPSYMPSAFVSRRYLSKNKYFFGVDYAFHNDVLAFMRYYDVDHGRQKQESWDGYVFAGNEFLLGRVGIVTQLGVNYKNTFLKFDPYCEKIGGNLYLMHHEHGAVKDVFFSAMLLAHGFVAELAEFGLGVGVF